MPYYGGWAPYVPVAERRRRALKKVTQLRKRGLDIQPIEIDGRKISKTFWGQAWCDHMESLGDFENRLPRGRTYVRNGSVCHLAIKKGCVTAMVSGSSMYDIKIKIHVLPKTKWNKVKTRCAGQIGSLLELLQGRLSDSVMGVVTNSRSGLFPLSKEIHLSCSCPDWAVMCKHVAAVLYGVGVRLDEQPELLFRLRGVKHEELISTNTEDAVGRATRRGGKRKTLAGDDLGAVFGIELDNASKHNSDSVDGNAPMASITKKRKSIARKKSKSATMRRKKSKAVKKSTAAKSTKEKAASKKLKKSVNKKASTKPNKKTTPAQTPKENPTTHLSKKSSTKKTVTKKQAGKKKAATKKKSATKTVKRTATKRRPSKKKAGKK